MRRRSLWLLRRYIHCQGSRLCGCPCHSGQLRAQGALCSEGPAALVQAPCYFRSLQPAQELGAESAPSPFALPTRHAGGSQLPQAPSRPRYPGPAPPALFYSVCSAFHAGSGRQTNSRSMGTTACISETSQRSNSSIFIYQFIPSKSPWGRGSSSRHALPPTVCMTHASSAPDKLLGCSQESKSAPPPVSLPLCSHSFAPPGE